jgi:hypothetical protein
MAIIFDIGTFLITLNINEFSPLRDICGIYVTKAPRCGELVELPVLISLAQRFVFQSYNYFS